MPPSNSHHVHEQARSYKNLQQAREKAAKSAGYNSHFTRSRLASLFQTRFGSPPHNWQLDVAESMLVGLDATVIARTGTGKTIPFMLLLDTSKKIVVISPLKVLQDDQAARFNKLDIPAVAVNGDTWSQKMKQVSVPYHFTWFSEPLHTREMSSDPGT